MNTQQVLGHQNALIIPSPVVTRCYKIMISQHRLVLMISSHEHTASARAPKRMTVLVHVLKSFLLEMLMKFFHYFHQIYLILLRIASGLT